MGGVAWLGMLLEHAAVKGNIDLVTTLLENVRGHGASSAEAGITADMDVQFGDDFRTAHHVADAERAAHDWG